MSSHDLGGGKAASASIDDVNVEEIAGQPVAVTTVPGTMPVEGTVAAGDADDGANPQKVGGVVRTTLPSLSNGQRAELVFDDRSQAHTRDAAFNELLLANHTLVDNPPSTQHTSTPFPIADLTNQADGSFPSTDGVPTGDWPNVSICITGINITSIKVEVTNDLAEPWDDITPAMNFDHDDGAIGHAYTELVAGGVATEFRLSGRIGYRYFRLTVDFSGGTNTFYASAMMWAD